MTPRVRFLWAMAIGAAFAVAALMLSVYVSPAAGWALIILVLAVAYIRTRRGMRR